MRRTVIEEWLDTDACTPAERERSLQDLRNISRWFGGISSTAAMLERVVRRTGKRELSLLDVGSATGEIPFALRKQFVRRGVLLRVSLLDRVVEHFPVNGQRGTTHAVAGDALALPFAANSFDVVTCSLFAHHLEPEQIVSFVNESLRAARVAVLISDLQRSALHLGLVYAGAPLFGRVTRHDAPASVLRSYTKKEMSAMLRQTRASDAEVGSHYLYRMGAIAWK